MEGPNPGADASLHNIDLTELLDGGNIVAFQRILVGVTGDVKAALFLSQALYWDRIKRKEERERQRKDPKVRVTGWFYKTHNEWREEIGLSRKSVDRCRRILGEAEGLGILSEKLIGVPPICHYRVNREQLKSLVYAAMQAESVADMGEAEEPDLSERDELSVGDSIRPEGADQFAPKGQINLSERVKSSTETTSETTSRNGNPLPPEGGAASPPGASSGEGLFAEGDQAALFATEPSPEDPMQVAARLVRHVNGLRGSEYQITGGVLQEIAKRLRSRKGSPPPYTEGDLRLVADYRWACLRGTPRERQGMSPVELWGTTFVGRWFPPAKEWEADGRPPVAAHDRDRMASRNAAYDDAAREAATSSPPPEADVNAWRMEFYREHGRGPTEEEVRQEQQRRAREAYKGTLAV